MFMAKDSPLDIDVVIAGIPSLAGCRLSFVPKGFSGDKLYRVESADGSRKLLRVFDVREYGRKRDEFAILQEMERLGVRCTRPLEIGELPGPRSTFGYMLLSYIDGSDAEEVLPALSPREQYQIGLEAGAELRSIHRFGAVPEGLVAWHESKSAKHRKYVEQYQACGVRIKGDERILGFIERNLKWMERRPNGFQHDDFHVSNLIVADNRLAGVIDFNRFDWGDPEHDFVKVGMFSRGVSVPFSIGQIRGYFGEREPDEDFWSRYALYLAMTVISSVVWTLKVSPETMDRMMEKIDLVLEDHQGFERVVPVWYEGGSDD